MTKKEIIAELARMSDLAVEQANNVIKLVDHIKALEGKIGHLQDEIEELEQELDRRQV